MRRRFAMCIARVVAVAVVLALGCLVWAGEKKPAAKQYPTIGKIERLDPRFGDLISKDAAIEKLAEGFKWTEGPVWIPGRNALLFSDIPNNEIVQWLSLIHI